MNEVLADEVVVLSGLGFPEGPAFDRDGNFYVGDMDRGTVTRRSADGTVTIFLETGGGINSTKVGPDQALWAVDNSGRPMATRAMIAPAMGGSGPNPSQYKGPPKIHRVDLRSGRAEVVFVGGPGSFTGVNDLVFDPQGNCYFTTGWGGEVWFFNRARELSRVATGYAFANGVWVTEDAATLLVVETPTGVVWRHDILAPGKVGPRQGFGLMPQIPARWAFPGRDQGDSMTMDAKGNALVCGWQGGQIAVFDPKGELIDRILLSDRWITNAAFGGPDYRDLYVTQSMSGKVVTTRWKHPGMVPFPLR